MWHRMIASKIDKTYLHGADAHLERVQALTISGPPVEDYYEKLSNFCLDALEHSKANTNRNQIAIAYNNICFHQRHCEAC